MMYSVTARIERKSSLNDLMKNLDENLVFYYCNQILDEYIVSGPITEEKEKVIHDFFKSDSLKIYNKSGKISFIILNCQSPKEIDHLMVLKQYLIENECFIVTYIQLYNDWEYYNLLIIGEENLMEIQDKSSERGIEIISTKPIPNFSAISLSPYIDIKKIKELLSPSQFETMKLAFNQGYYQIPRKITLSEIGVIKGKSRSTVEKSFRVAENKIMDSLIPELYYYLNDLDRYKSQNK